MDGGGGNRSKGEIHKNMHPTGFDPATCDLQVPSKPLMCLNHLGDKCKRKQSGFISYISHRIPWKPPCPINNTKPTSGQSLSHTGTRLLTPAQRPTATGSTRRQVYCKPYSCVNTLS